MKSRYALLPLIALVALAASRPFSTREPEKFALIVGINDYINYGDEPGGDLLGPRNDATAMRDVLVGRWGFKPDNVKMLLDRTATRDGIRQGLSQWVGSRARPGDLVVFYFSGHGSQVRDRNGDEADGLDETICPSDVLRNSMAKDIKDDELGAWLRGLPTKNVTVILDSCHSGTATRSLASFVRRKALDRRVSDMPEEPGTSEAPAVATRSLFASTASTAAAAAIPTDSYGEGAIEFAAARANETAIESMFETGQGMVRPGGAFTVALVKYLWQVPPTTSHEDLLRMAREEVKKGRFAQMPNMSAAGEGSRRPLFHVAGSPAAVAMETGPVMPEPSRPAPVIPTPVPGKPTPVPVKPTPAPAKPPVKPSTPPSRVVVAPDPTVAKPVPALSPELVQQGYVPVLAMHPNGEVELGGGSSAGITVGSLYQVGATLLRVDKVDAKVARASRPPAGTRGIVVVRRDSVATGAPARLIAYQYPESRLRVSIAGLQSTNRPLLEQAMRKVSSLDVRTVAADRADLLVRRDAEAFTVVSPDGEPRYRVPVGAESVVDSVVNHLVKEAGALRLASLTNPGHPFAVSLQFAGGQDRVRVGDEIDFKVRSEKDGFLTIVDVDAAGAVNVIFPNEWERNNRISAGEEITVPSEAMKANNIKFLVSPPSGHSIIRAFVTEKPVVIPANLTARDAEVVMRALWAAAGPAPLVGSNAVPVRNWATASVTYEIVK